MKRAWVAFTIIANHVAYFTLNAFYNGANCRLAELIKRNIVGRNCAST